MPKGFKIAPVEGRMLLDPFTIGATHRRLGFARIVDAENQVRDPLSGNMVPAERWEWHGDEETVGETTDHYMRRAILAGDADYVSSVDIAADGTTKPLPLDVELLTATKFNQALRARAAAAADKAQASAEADHAKALAGVDAAVAKKLAALGPDLVINL